MGWAVVKLCQLTDTVNIIPFNSTTNSVLWSWGYITSSRFQYTTICLIIQNGSLNILLHRAHFAHRLQNKSTTVPNTFIHCTLTTRLAFAIFQLPYFSNALFLFNCNLITPTCCKSVVSTSAVPQLTQSQHPDLLQHLFPFSFLLSTSYISLHSGFLLHATPCCI